MRNKSSVILLEFNELTPALMDRFISERTLPHFRRFRQESHIYTTDAQEQGELLNPWVQWVTVHTGLPAEEHGVNHLDDGHKLEVDPLWELVSDAGLPVWVCGSMNARYRSSIRGCVLPDPWTTKVSPYPAELNRYHQFIRAHVQEHTNDHSPLSAGDYLRFLAFMTTHGISANTVGSTVLQLMQEFRGRYKWKRVAIMDQLQWDVFKWYYKSIRPAFSTFFLNSTAHLQHMYWRNLSPELFHVKPSATEQRECANAVAFGYQAMDALLGKFVELADRDAATTLVFCTALSQQPCTDYDSFGGKRFYRPRNFEQLLRLVGITAQHTVAPVMSEQFLIRFQSRADSMNAEKRLRGLRVGERPALTVKRTSDEIFTGCCIFDEIDATAMLSMEGVGGLSPFFDIFYEADSLKSGMHHPDGILWVRTPRRSHEVHSEKVSLRSIAPTILSMLAVPQPEYMKELPLPVLSESNRTSNTRQQ